MHMGSFTKLYYQRDTLNHGKPHSGMNNPWYKAKYKNI